MKQDKNEPMQLLNIGYRLVWRYWSYFKPEGEARGFEMASIPTNQSITDLNYVYYV